VSRRADIHSAHWYIAKVPTGNIRDEIGHFPKRVQRARVSPTKAASVIDSMPGQSKDFRLLFLEYPFEPSWRVLIARAKGISESKQCLLMSGYI
jgi:hypothetical protein